MKATVSFGQIVVVLAVTDTDGVTGAVTTIVIGLEVIGEGDAQFNELVISTLYTSPFAASVVVNVAFVAVGISVEPFFHWYVAAPPFIGAAENIMDSPKQIVDLETTIETDEVSAGFTVTV